VQLGRHHSRSASKSGRRRLSEATKWAPNS
jgi:hypothetical protein